MRYFITGTDTGVGKTTVSSLLIQAIVEEGGRVFPYKPISCGDRTDAIALLQASDREDLSLDDVNPVYLKSPASPYAACLIENRTIDLDLLLKTPSQHCGETDSLIIEGAGGWEVPVTKDLTMAGLAARFDLPVIVVVDNKLGALNHTILTVRSIQSMGLTCAGLILNQVAEERDSASISNRHVLEQVLDVPVLAEVMHDADWLDPWWT